VKFVNCLSAALLIAGAAFQAQAAGSDSANIDFSGNITSSTCDVSIDGISASKEVKLPDITVSAMQAAVSSPAMKTKFQITVKNCATEPAGGKVKGQFSTTGNYNSTSKALLNAAAGDKDAGFQVEDTATSTIIDFTSATPQSEADDTTNGVFNYTVGYIYSGSGTPTVGVVKANTTFVTTYPNKLYKINIS
jgi:major type 1 subunit fimbrin (pilin)